MVRPYPNDGVPSATFPLYSRGNMGEAFPNVISPMTGSLMLDASTRAQTRWFVETGALSKEQVDDPANAMFVQFHGYLYANASLARIAAVRAPGVGVDDIDAQYGGVGVLPPYRPRRGDRSLLATLRMGRFASRAFRTGDAERARTAQREVDTWVSSLSPVDAASDTELLARARQTSRWFERMLPNMMTVTFHAGASRIVIERMTAAAGEPDASNAITSGLGGVASASPPRALWELGRKVRHSSHLQEHFSEGTEGLDQRLRSDPACAEFVEEFDVFLTAFGFHGADELELASPKWGTDRDLALKIVERLREAPDERDPVRLAHSLAANRAAVIERVRQKLRAPRRLLFDRAVRSAALYVPEREASKAALVRALFESRCALNELARRHDIPRDNIYLLVHTDLEAALDDPAAFASIIEQCRAQRESLQQRVPPFWFDHEIPDPSGWPLRSEGRTTSRSSVATRVQGQGVSAGVVTGRARVILDPNEPGDLEPDEILVAPQTDPAWTPLFLGAAGVIVEYGAVMSHAAIVARELGIPAVVGVDGATADIETGATVTIDGTTGLVTIER
jgi:pyruvate,water dikinase